MIIPKSDNVSVGFYSHMGGKIVTAVVIEGSSGHESVAREIAMHIAAESPEYLQPSDVPADIQERESDIAKAQLQGKPANMIEKIVEGKLKAFYDQVCLLCQKFVKDNALTVAAVVEAEAKRSGKALSIQRFVRWRVGG